MKKILLFIACALCANLLFGQTVAFAPPSQHVPVAGASAAFDLTFGIPFGPGEVNSTGFTITAQSVSPSTATLSITGSGSHRTVTVTTPTSAPAGQVYTVSVTCNDPAVGFGGPYTGTGTCSVTVDAVLSVTWSSFTAAQTPNANKLSWTTASEKDNSGFVVERSSNGKDFQAIGQVKATGNAASTSQYAFEDADAKAAVSYYRVVSVSIDGAKDYTKVVSVVKKGAFDIKTLPTASGTRIQIGADQTGENATIQVLNLNGQVISSKNVTLDGSVTEAEMDLPNAGLFIINVKTASQSVSTKVMKF